MSAIPRDDLVRIQHMADAAGKALEFVQDRERTDLDGDEMLSLAVIRLLEILGEAASRVSPETRADFEQVPWSEIPAPVTG